MKQIMNPAMIATWCFGILLVLTPGVDRLDRRLVARQAACVILLSGFHGAMSRWRKDFLQDANRHSQRFYPDRQRNPDRADGRHRHHGHRQALRPSPVEPSRPFSQESPPCRLRIVDVREVTKPISSPIRNAYIDFSKMTSSLVAVVTNVERDGEPVVGYGFNSNGRYGQGGLIRERFAPRILEAEPATLLDATGENLDPDRVWAA